MMVFSLILASTLEGGIGNNNNIPWEIRDDIIQFRKITSEVNYYIKKNAIIMGRKTWESLPYKPLKDRINIIISTNPKKLEYDIDNETTFCFTNLDDAFNFCEMNLFIDKVFVIGGKSLYDMCLNNKKYSSYIQYIHLSLIIKKYECDRFINIKEIFKKYKNYNIYDIIFNKEYIYLKLINKNKINL